MKIKKKLTAIIVGVMMFNVVSINVFATTTIQDGLEVTLTTNKEEYNKDEEITAILNVKNTNDTAITNILLEGLIPEGYKLADNSIATKQIEMLNADELATLTVTYVLDTGGLSTQTGDNSNIVLWTILTALAGGGLIITLKLGKKKRNSIFSLFLCIATVGTVVSSVLPMKANAAEVQSKSISITENIIVENTNLTLNAIIKYDIAPEQNDKPTEPEPSKPENPSEADEYYWNNSKVIEVINAEESNDVPTESEVINILKNRGFIDFSITYEYSIVGEYDGETEVSDSSTNKHPMYQTSYVSKNNEVWTIFVINGVVIANPVSFNLESELEAQLLISESENLTSYDDETNKFYVTIPKESAVIVKIVSRIDAETLDRLTIEEISKL